MNKSTIIFQCLLALFFYTSIVNAQSNWDIPEEEQDNLSIQMFDEEMQLEGKKMYSNSCISCHGNPTQADYTAMAPSPGDVASEIFQNQKDGALLYKIKKGRGTMPSFEDTYSETEIWNLVAYIRSFHENYTQTLPNLEGIDIPKLALNIGYDENIDKLVIKVSDYDSIMQADVAIKAYVKGMFGNLLLGKEITNELGIAYVDIDSKLPGDENGNVNVIVKATKGYGSAKKEQSIAAATPTIKKSAIEGRHLWSVAKKAPWWMIISFNIIGIGVWIVILRIIFGLRKIKKLQ